VRVVIEATAEAAVERVARCVADRVRSYPRSVLGLATGRTMEPVYAKLVHWHQFEGLSLRDVRSFNLDEYVGAAPDASWSMRAFVFRHLVERTDLPPSHVHLPDGAARDVFAEAERYEARLRAAGGVDLQLLGLGANGHLGFNEPGSSLGGRTRVAVLAPETLEANRDALPRGGARPRAAITLGLGTILAARTCLLLALGSEKAEAAAAMLEGPVSARLPASALQLHPDAVVVLDAPASGALARRDDYERAERIRRELILDNATE
jgi:glucosamine-6-phosphate deaminase